MHKETVFGEINLRRITTVSLKEAIVNPKAIVDKELKWKLLELIEQGFNEKQIKKYFEENKEIWHEVDLKKIPVYYFTKDTKERFFASRKSLDTSFDKKCIEEKVADTGIQKILLRHLELEGNNPEVAFSAEGIERMNKNMQALNDGHRHQPILKVRKYEKADKFSVGQKGNKSKKFVEAAKGTNLFFAVYEKEVVDKNSGEVKKIRTFDSIPLNVVISRQKKGLSPAPEDEHGQPPVFVLSPNDLVYVPTCEELRTGKVVDALNPERIYKMVSCTGNQCFFIPFSVARVLEDKKEFFSLNKIEKAITGEMIKEICIPLKVDRLGNITFI